MSPFWGSRGRLPAERNPLAQRPDGAGFVVLQHDVRLVGIRPRTRTGVPLPVGPQHDLLGVAHLESGVASDLEAHLADASTEVEILGRPLAVNHVDGVLLVPDVDDVAGGRRRSDLLDEPGAHGHETERAGPNLEAGAGEVLGRLEVGPVVVHHAAVDADGGADDHVEPAREILIDERHGCLKRNHRIHVSVDLEMEVRVPRQCGVDELRPAPVDAAGAVVGQYANAVLALVGPVEDVEEELRPNDTGAGNSDEDTHTYRQAWLAIYPLVSGEFQLTMP